MKIVFVLQDDIRDKKTWSGVPYYLTESLMRQFETVHIISPVPSKPFHRLAENLTELIDRSQKIFTRHSRFDFKYSNSLLKHYGQYIDDELAKIEYDIVISTSVFPFYYTSFKKPLVQITDGTPKLIFEHYYKNRMHKNLLTRMEDISMKTVSKSSMVVASSGWCADSVINDYGISESKVIVIPFGANVEEGDIKQNERDLNKRRNINFLFIGADWERKGGEMTVRICDSLISDGYKIKLAIAGCRVHEQYRRDYINNISSLDKNSESDRIKMQDLFSGAHFFILPSKADMSPIALCDAAAYGIPAITSNTGGIPEIVTDKVTGIILDKEADEKNYCSRISELIENTNLYRSMCIESKIRYENLLNWDSFAKNLRNICNDLVNQ